MDSSSLVMDRQALYPRKPGNNTNGNLFPTQRSDSMTLQQQQQLLNLLNAHAAGGGGAGISGLRYLGACSNGTAAPGEVQQRVPPRSYAAAPLVSPHPVPFHPPLPSPTGPVYSSMPAPRLMHQHSNPPLLPSPFSRSSSLPTSAPARPHFNCIQRSKPVGPPAVPRPNGVKEQQKSRPSKPSTVGGAAPAAVVKPKEEASTAVGKNKVKGAKQPNVSVGAVENKLQETSPTAKAKKGGVHRAAEVVTVTDSTGFSVYSLAPHPSSLPLPRLISLRPKAILVPSSCNAKSLGSETDPAEVPGAASNDLRCLLRL